MESTNCVAIVQARMGSTRLPGKMMKSLFGRPLIDYALGRLCSVLKPVGCLDCVVLATSIEASNAPLVNYVAENWPEVIIVRGPEDDVLSRFIDAVQKTDANLIVRATGDCPLINIKSMYYMVDALNSSFADIVNYMPGYEYVDKGLEVVTAEALLRLYQNPNLTSQDREHVTSLMYRQPGRYKVKYVESDPALQRGDIRLTIDTPDDFRFFERLFQAIGKEPLQLNLNEVVEFLDKNPEIKSINSSSGRKSTRHERARLGFRCDGGLEIGLGHVVGSIRLANLLSKKMGIGVEFVVRKHPAVESLLKDSGFSMEVIPEKTPAAKDIDRLIEKTVESDWSGILFNFCKDDLIKYTPYFRKIKQNKIPLLFMDNPLPPSCYMADMLINALPHPDYDGYDPANHPACFDGLEYFLSGFEKSPSNRIIKPNIDRVLIAMGGADKFNLTSLVIDALSKAGFNGFVDVVLGAANLHIESVVNITKNATFRSSIENNVSNLKERILSADIGFSSLGLTTYEMAFWGLPALIVSGNELNYIAAENFTKRYASAIHVGNYTSISADDIKNQFVRIQEDNIERERMSKAGMVIGSSVDKITDKFQEFLK